jgi:hypothetical protein
LSRSQFQKKGKKSKDIWKCTECQETKLAKCNDRSVGNLHCNLSLFIETCYLESICMDNFYAKSSLPVSDLCRRVCILSYSETCIVACNIVLKRLCLFNVISLDN